MVMRMHLLPHQYQMHFQIQCWLHWGDRKRIITWYNKTVDTGNPPRDPKRLWSTANEDNDGVLSDVVDGRKELEVSA